jgi:methionine-rich copper-binding protein CopC
MGGLLSGQVLAHAGYQDSDPQPGAVLQSAPAQVKMWFTEDLDPASSLTVQAADGTVVSNGPAQVSPDNTQLLIVSLKPIGNGTYTVLWHSVADDDKGVEEGQFKFQVQAPSAPKAPVVRVSARLGDRTIRIDGRSSVMDVAPQKEGAVVYLPVRSFVEGLGGSVTWDGTARQVSGQVLGHRFLLKIGSSTLMLDGQAQALPAAVFIDSQASRTMVPIDTFSKAIGLRTQFQGDSGAITVTEGQ